MVRLLFCLRFAFVFSLVTAPDQKNGTEKDLQSPIRIQGLSLDDIAGFGNQARLSIVFLSWPAVFDLHPPRSCIWENLIPGTSPGMATLALKIKTSKKAWLLGGWDPNGCQDLETWFDRPW